MAKRKGVIKTKPVVFKIEEVELPHYWICWDCAKKKKGKTPKGWVGTVMVGECPYCGKPDTIVPIVDFIWPGQKYYVWD